MGPRTAPPRQARLAGTSTALSPACTAVQRRSARRVGNTGSPMHACDTVGLLCVLRALMSARSRALTLRGCIGGGAHHDVIVRQRVALLGTTVAGGRGWLACAERGRGGRSPSPLRPRHHRCRGAHRGRGRGGARGPQRHPPHAATPCLCQVSAPPPRHAAPAHGGGGGGGGGRRVLRKVS